MQIAHMETPSTIDRNSYRTTAHTQCELEASILPLSTSRIDETAVTQKSMSGPLSSPGFINDSFRTSSTHGPQNRYPGPQSAIINPGTLTFAEKDALIVKVSGYFV